MSDFLSTALSFRHTTRAPEFRRRLSPCGRDPRERWDAEVIVVNDGSTDSTARLVRDFAVSAPEVRLLENPGNHGKGYSVRAGF